MDFDITTGEIGGGTSGGASPAPFDITTGQIGGAAPTTPDVSDSVSKITENQTAPAEPASEGFWDSIKSAFVPSTSPAENFPTGAVQATPSSTPNFDITKGTIGNEAPADINGSVSNIVKNSAPALDPLPNDSLWNNIKDNFISPQGKQFGDLVANTIEGIPAAAVAPVPVRPLFSTKTVMAPRIAAELSGIGSGAIEGLIGGIVDGYTGVKELLSGNTNASTKLPFDPTRIGITPNSQGGVDNIGARTMEKLAELNNSNPGHPITNGILAALEPINAVMGALGAGDLAKGGARAILDTTKFDPSVEISRAKLGLTGQDVSNESVWHQFMTRAQNLIEHINSGTDAEKYKAQLNDLGASTQNLLEALNGKGVPTLNKFGQMVQDIARLSLSDVTKPIGLERFGAASLGDTGVPKLGPGETTPAEQVQLPKGNTPTPEDAAAIIKETSQEVAMTPPKPPLDTKALGVPDQYRTLALQANNAVSPQDFISKAVSTRTNQGLNEKQLGDFYNSVKDGVKEMSAKDTNVPTKNTSPEIPDNSKNQPYTRLNSPEIPTELKDLAQTAKNYKTLDGFKSELPRFDSVANNARAVRAANIEGFPRLQGDETVTIYRGAHPDAKGSLKPGDWITLSEPTARNYSSNIQKLEVPKSDIVDPNIKKDEYIYAPKNLETTSEELFNKSKGIDQQQNKDNNEAYGRNRTPLTRNGQGDTTGSEGTRNDVGGSQTGAEKDERRVLADLRSWAISRYGGEDSKTIEFVVRHAEEIGKGEPVQINQYTPDVLEHLGYPKETTQQIIPYRNAGAYTHLIEQEAEWKGAYGENTIYLNPKFKGDLMYENGRLVPHEAAGHSWWEKLPAQEKTTYVDALKSDTKTVIDAWKRSAKDAYYSEYWKETLQKILNLTKEVIPTQNSDIVKRALTEADLIYDPAMTLKESVEKSLNLKDNIKKLNTFLTENGYNPIKFDQKTTSIMHENIAMIAENSSDLKSDNPIVQKMINDMRDGTQTFGKEKQPDTFNRLPGEESNVTIVRHGETDLNEDGKSRGWDNSKLNEDGIAAAEKVGEDLKDKGITKIVSSDLPRAKQTAQIIKGITDADLSFNPDLRTWDIGDLTGKDQKMVDPIIEDYARNKPDVPLPGGESFNDFKDRFLDATRKVTEDNEGEKLAIVTHNQGERMLSAWEAAGQPVDNKINIDQYFRKGIEPGTSRDMEVQPWGDEMSPPSEMKSIKETMNADTRTIPITKNAMGKLPQELQDRKAMIDVTASRLQDDKAQELKKYIVPKGDFAGRLPEVTGNKADDRASYLKGISNPNVIAWSEHGDDIARNLGYASPDEAEREFMRYRSELELLREEKSIWAEEARNVLKMKKYFELGARDERALDRAAKKEGTGDVLTDLRDVNPPEVRGGIRSPKLNFDQWKDISAARLSRDTFERDIEKVAPPKDVAAIKKFLIDPIKENELARVEDNNKLKAIVAKKIGDLKIPTKYRPYIQQFGERIMTREQLNELAPDKADSIEKAANIFRDLYDRYIDDWNKVRAQYGYEAVPKRSDYFHHFDDVNWFTEHMGFLQNAKELPTTIAGKTEYFKPGKIFTTAELRRVGNSTSFDPIKGFNKYLDSVSKQRFHLDSLQRGRALENYLTLYSKAAEGMGRPLQLANTSVNLQEYVNTQLAGKLAAWDRGIEKTFGRTEIDKVQRISQLINKNIISGNIAAAMSHLVTIPFNFATVDKVSFIRGLMDTAVAPVKKDPFTYVDGVKSSFLTRRFPTKDILPSKLKTAEESLNFFMNTADKFKARLAVASKYYEGISQGLDKETAMTRADTYATKVVGDNSFGQQPNILKNKVLSIIGPFQSSVNNGISILMHDIPYDAKGNKWKIISKILQYSIAIYLLSEWMKQVKGTAKGLNPIEFALDLAGATDATKGQNIGSRAVTAGTEILSELPFTSLFTGGSPGATVLTNIFSALKTGPKWGKLIEEIGSSILPTGGGTQFLKTFQGAQSIKQGEAPTLADKARALFFGASTNPLNVVSQKLDAKVTAAQKKVDGFDPDLVSQVQPVFDEAKKAGFGTPEADQIVADAFPATTTGDQQYKVYQALKAVDAAKDAETLQSKVLPTVQAANQAGFGTDAADKIVADAFPSTPEGDREYDAYKAIKTALYGTSTSPDGSPLPMKKATSGTAVPSGDGSVWDKQSFITHIANIAKALGTDPVQTFNDIFAGNGSWKVTGFKNGQVIVNRMSLQDSEGVKKAEGGDNKNYKLDHSVSLESGGNNGTDNLQLIPTGDVNTPGTWAWNTPYEDLIGNALQDDKITGSQAREYLIRLKATAGEPLSPALQKEYKNKYNSEALSPDQLKELLQ